MSEQKQTYTFVILKGQSTGHYLRSEYMGDWSRNEEIFTIAANVIKRYHPTFKKPYLIVQPQRTYIIPRENIWRIERTEEEEI